VYGVACNARGRVEFAGLSQSFPGGAAVVSPSGQRLHGPDEEMALATLSRDSLLEARARFEYTFRFRRPELYRLLAD
jgi:predicted amidohydrolase